MQPWSMNIQEREEIWWGRERVDATCHDPVWWWI